MGRRYKPDELIEFSEEWTAGFDYTEKAAWRSLIHLLHDHPVFVKAVGSVDNACMLAGMALRGLEAARPQKPAAPKLPEPSLN